MIAAALALVAGPMLANDLTDAELEERREQLLEMGDLAIDRLLETNEVAAALFEETYGVAVFDATKGGLIVTGTGGTGAASPRSGGENVFMHMGGGGVALGAGLKHYKLVLFIHDEETYEEFVNGQWNGSVSAQAAAGNSGVSEHAHFRNDVVAFQLDEGGLMAQADLSGVRFWRSNHLNPSS